MNRDATTTPTAARLSALALAAAATLCLAGTAHADTRCGTALQNDVCLEANPTCPPAPAPLGPGTGSWPLFQSNLQHTGDSAAAGPTCGKVLWTRKLRGKILSSASLVHNATAGLEELYVPVGKAPVCALDPADGSVRWCGTNNKGKYVDRSTPAVGNGHLLYVGTRDNDLWAINVAEDKQKPSVEWRQKICTDGDVTTPPAIGANGVVYMGSDSLGAGTLMAMCPGDKRQPKWCINPIGGGIRNASPALSVDGHHLYITIGGSALGAFDPETGAELWRVQLEPPGSVGRAPNYAPVVNPSSGKIYLGTKSGIWEITPGVDGAGKETGTGRLLFDTRGSNGQRVYTPPALDVSRATLVFGASRGNDSTLYVTDLDGKLKWQRAGLSGRFRNNPPVIDRDGRIYLAFAKGVYAFNPDGTTVWALASTRSFSASPILAEGRLYVGTTNGLMMAVGCSNG
ncbi:PQQ-binding-like beta-propeller repeat protein [Candidatus Binatia bacterium]|nr:PQQ-binding-like beta-propeller repeat protein [Candidatus Binatia bacterium]